jgi:hypothetical protein
MIKSELMRRRHPRDPLIGDNCFFVTCEAIRVFKPFVLLALKCVKRAFNTARVMKFMVLFAWRYVIHGELKTILEYSCRCDYGAVKELKKSKRQKFTMNDIFHVINNDERHFCLAGLLVEERFGPTGTYDGYAF